ncbi:hypothetical protein [Sulfurimonas sp.]|uniref:hypothetical protein n=1 Tax=Sulfurimonas sp. TaxID=2022749 RepID=UPI003566AE84
MKKLNLAALLFGAMLFLGLGATAASAEGMKCGAGKCGSSMKQPATKCGGEKEKTMRNNSDKCGGEKKAAAKKDEKKPMKCGAGKCGSK